MRRRDTTTIATLLLAILLGAILGCGAGNSEANTEPPVSPTALPGPAPVPPTPLPPAPTPEPIAVSTTNLDPEPTGDPMADDSFKLGESIFIDSAYKKGGIGCSTCHGREGRGDIGPNIRGKTPGDIAFALDSVDAMEFLNLSQKKTEAVSEYLKWLTTQP